MKPGLELPARKRTQAEADAILDALGRRCALAWWHRPTSTLCDRLTVDDYR